MSCKYVNANVVIVDLFLRSVFFLKFERVFSLQNFFSKDRLIWKFFIVAINKCFLLLRRSSFVKPRLGFVVFRSDREKISVERKRVSLSGNIFLVKFINFIQQHFHWSKVVRYDLVNRLWNDRVTFLVKLIFMPFSLSNRWSYELRSD